MCGKLSPVGLCWLLCERRLLSRSWDGRGSSLPAVEGGSAPSGRSHGLTQAGRSRAESASWRELGAGSRPPVQMVSAVWKPDGEDLAKPQRGNDLWRLSEDPCKPVLRIHSFAHSLIAHAFPLKRHHARVMGYDEGLVPEGCRPPGVVPRWSPDGLQPLPALQCDPSGWEVTLEKGSGET